MKKKLLSILLCTAMVLSLAACGGEKTPANGEESSSAPESSSVEQSQEEVKAEALPEAFAHLTFDEGANEGYTAVTQADKAADSINDGATFDIVPTDVTFGYADGPVGQALYINGKFGVDLNLQPTNTDAYTVSFWMNADRLSNFGATLQYGYNMGRAADAGNNVTWVNVTQVDFPGMKVFPIVWSRNEASDALDGTDCWPWMYAFDEQIHGKKEWVHVTIVVTEEEITSAVGGTIAAAEYYLNGQKVYDSYDNFTNHTYWADWTWDATIAPNTMKPGDDEFESLFGINYWDSMYKGFVDDLYVFDSALSAGQVLSLYELGNPAVESVAPAQEEEAPEPQNPVITAQGTLVGAPDFTTGWWKEFSDIYEVAEGTTVSKTFINYHPAVCSNWNNFVVVLQAVGQGHANDPAIHADVNPDYKEYGVVRVDNWGWNSVADTSNLEALGWTLESNWDWANFLPNLQGATVTVSVTNNGTTADIVMDVIGADGNAYYQKYLGIAIDGPLYFTLGVDGACIDVLAE
ncbi:MAG: hypothetical protein IJY10_08540 [Lachnospiraceae bacterium]|nr:hypothetical protein [Lachnospiraceae bacterium]